MGILWFGHNNLNQHEVPFPPRHVKIHRVPSLEWTFCFLCVTVDYLGSIIERLVATPTKGHQDMRSNPGLSVSRAHLQTGSLFWSGASGTEFGVNFRWMSSGETLPQTHHQSFLMGLKPLWLEFCHRKTFWKSC